MNNVYIIFYGSYCSLLSSVLEVTWPESLSWILFGFVTYFSYGMTHSNAANNDIEAKQCNQDIGRSNRNILRSKSTDKFSGESIVLSKRQEAFRNDKGIEIVENRKYKSPGQHDNSSCENGIIRNYRAVSNNISLLEIEEYSQINTSMPTQDENTFSTKC